MNLNEGEMTAYIHVGVAADDEANYAIVHLTGEVLNNVVQSGSLLWVAARIADCQLPYEDKVARVLQGFTIALCLSGVILNNEYAMCHGASRVGYNFSARVSANGIKRLHRSLSTTQQMCKPVFISDKDSTAFHSIYSIQTIKTDIIAPPPESYEAHLQRRRRYCGEIKP